MAKRLVPDPPAIGLATGFRFPDALIGGVHVDRHGGPILLPRPDELPAVVQTYLGDDRVPIIAGYLYGGVAALEESVRTAVDAIIHS
ncbi:MAG: cell wall-binding repeat-containing protein [Actinobacteria bacterium]|nr:cell wall-binding repeat-containing protein [Actinomycetota bacterium]